MCDAAPAIIILLSGVGLGACLTILGTWLYAIAHGY